MCVCFSNIDCAISTANRKNFNYKRESNGAAAKCVEQLAKYKLGMYVYICIYVSVAVNKCVNVSECK